MRLLLCIAIILAVSLCFEKSIKKHAPFWYCGTLLLGVVLLHVPYTAPYFRRGIVATALFICVMYARILPVKWRLFRTLMGLRAQLAIMGSLLIWMHNVTYLLRYLRSGVSMSVNERLAACCSVLMLLLLPPLTITSFTRVRRRMSARKWKKIQRWSYLFYGLIYCHVALLYVPRVHEHDTDSCVQLGIYTFLFGFYAIRRIALWAQTQKKNALSRSLQHIGLPCISMLSLMILCTSLVPVNESETAMAETTTVTAESEPASEAIAYADGVWEGTGFGYQGDVTVSVTVEKGVITQIQILSYEDDEEYFHTVADVLPQRILDAQSTDVDTVSSATYSSKGILKAVENALAQAH